jgi:hypothetical protein
MTATETETKTKAPAETNAPPPRTVAGMTGPVFRAVAFIALALTALLYLYGHFRWSAPLVPSVLSGLAGFLVIWAATMAAVELLHRHRRALARQAGRGITSGYSAARTRSAPLWQRIRRWAGRRWHERHPELCADIVGPCPYCDDSDADAVREAADRAHRDPWAEIAHAAEWGEITPAEAEAEAQRLAEHEGVTEPGAPAPGDISPNGDPDMTGTGEQIDRPRTPTGSQAIRGVPALWRQLSDAIAQFEPESHDELLAFMAGGINGFAALAKAYLEVYEHCRDVRKLSQASIGALEDTSDVVSDCMTTLAYARQKYVQAYDPAAEVADEHGLPTRAREFFAPGEN